MKTAQNQPIRKWVIPQMVREMTWTLLPVFHLFIALNQMGFLYLDNPDLIFSWSGKWIIFAVMTGVFSLLAAAYEKWQEFRKLPPTFDKNQSAQPLGFILAVFTGITLVFCYSLPGLFFSFLAIALAYLSSARKNKRFPHPIILSMIPFTHPLFFISSVVLVCIILSIIFPFWLVLPAFSLAILLFGLTCQLFSPILGEKPKALIAKLEEPKTEAKLPLAMHNRILQLSELVRAQPDKVSAFLESLRIAHPLEAGPQFQAILQKLPKHNALDNFERKISLEYLWETAENDLNQKKSTFGPQKYHAQFHYCHYCNSKVSRRTIKKVDYVECPKCLKYDHLFSDTEWIVGTPELNSPTQNGKTLFIPIWISQSRQFLPAEVDQVNIPKTYESAAEWMISAMFHHFAEKHPNLKGTIYLNLAPDLQLTENARRLVNAGIKAKYWIREKQ